MPFNSTLICSDYGIWSAGISIGLIKDVPTCEALLSRIEREAEDIISVKLGGLVIKEKAKL